MGAALSKWPPGPTKATLPAPFDLVLTFGSSEAWQHYFNSIIDSSQLVVVQFSHPCCDPCTTVEPDVLHLASKYTKVQFVKMHADDVKDVSKEYNVRVTPTFVFVKKGVEVERVIGEMNPELEKAVRKHRPYKKLPVFCWNVVPWESMGATLSKWTCGPTKLTIPTPSDLLLTFDSSKAWQHYFNSIKHSSQLVVVQFSHPRCQPCKRVELRVLRLASKYTKVQFVKMHTVDVFDVSMEFNVHSTPTFVFMKKGVEVGRVIGATYPKLEKAMRKHRPYHRLSVFCSRVVHWESMGAALSKWTRGPTPAPSDLLRTFDSSEAWQHYFNSIKHYSQLVVVEFSHPRCYDPSTLAEMHVLRLASKYPKVQFVKMQVDDVKDVSREYKVRATPTFVFLKKGVEVERLIGEMNPVLEKTVRKHKSLTFPFTFGC